MEASAGHAGEESLRRPLPPPHSDRHDRQRPLTWAIDGIVIGLKDGSQPNGNVLRPGAPSSRGFSRTGITRTGGANCGLLRTGSPLKEKIK